MATNKLGLRAIDIGSDRQLFIDDALIDPKQTEGVVRKLNPPRIAQRVLKPERPWEVLGVGSYGFVLNDGGTYKMYYLAVDINMGIHRCLAISQDGVHWERPNLRLVEFQGSKENNILAPFAAPESGVFIDPKAPPERRYKFVYTRGWPDPDDAGIYIAYSADGIHWQVPRQRLFPFVPDSHIVSFWDEQVGRYVAYFRGWNPGRVVLRAEMEDIEAPWPYDKAVKPYYIWGEDKIPIPSREFPTVIARDDRDPPNLHIYTNSVHKYPFAPDVYFAFPSIFFHYEGPEWQDRAVGPSDGPFEVQLCVSRDGKDWERIRQPYVLPEFVEEIDVRICYIEVGMIRRGVHLYQYIVLFPWTHECEYVWQQVRANAEEWVKKDLGGIYLGVQRLDGFLSMDAAYTGGILTTKPLVFRGHRLRLNLNTAATGWAKVAVLDENLKPIPGFSIEDCIAINGNFIEYEVRWKVGGSDVSALAGKPLRLQFVMRNTKLYAFQFVEVAPS